MKNNITVKTENSFQHMQLYLFVSFLQL